MALFLNPPRQWSWLPPALAAVVLWFAASDKPLPGWAAGLVVVVCCIMAAHSALALYAYLVTFRNHQALYGSPDALFWSAVQEAARLAENLKKLDDARLQVFALTAYNSIVTAGTDSAAVDGWLERFMVYMGTLSFEREQSERDALLRYAAENRGWLPAVRSTSDGSSARSYLSDATSRLIAAGIAEPAAGPNPARIKEWQRGGLQKAREVLL